MKTLSKSPKIKNNSLLMFALISCVLASFGCNNVDPSAELSGEKADAKMATEKIVEGDRLYNGRDDIARARVAVAALKQARTADPSNYEAAWKLSRAAYYVADHTDNNTERDNMFAEGTAAGKAAVKLQPDKADGHLWLGANYGGTAQNNTIPSPTSFNDVKGEMEAVIKIDEAYEGASAYVGLGRLYLQAPRMLGGDNAKAIEYLEKGLKLNPKNALLRYHLAEAFEQSNRDGEAKKQLDALLAMTPDPEHGPEHKDAVAKANKLLKKIEGK